jgi:DNA-binding GntR family transcriptional regulator
VSATPVREAMLDLVSGGLVDVVRNKGFRVTASVMPRLDAMAGACIDRGAGHGA